MRSSIKYVACTLGVVSVSFSLVLAAPKSPALVIDPKASTMTVHVWKQGIFAFAADNHVVDAPITSGTFDRQSNSIELKIESAKLTVLDPPLPSDRRAQVQANMLGPQVLDIAKYPEIIFHSTNSQATGPGQLTVTGDLTLHGETHVVVVQIVQIDPTHFKGSATVRQSAFGISPIRLAGGTVKVKDDVNVDFAIALKRAAE